MAFDRDKVIAAVTDYYEWLLRLHLRPDNLRRPPPGGWPEISPERFKMGKTDTVIDLVKHLPYVENDDNFVPLLVWSFSSSSDYSARKLQQDVTKWGGDGTYAGLGVQEAQYCSYEKLYKPFPHIISLACPKGKYGDHILCDTEDGEFTIWDPWEDHQSFPSAEACFAHTEREILELRVFPDTTASMKEMLGLPERSHKGDQDFKRVAREKGWPSDEFDWWEFTATCVEEVEGFNPILGDWGGKPASPA